MPINLHNRNFLKLLDFQPEEIQFLLNLSRELKRAKFAGCEQQHLRGKNIALIFEKPSTRTRCAFEVACFDQGAKVTCIDSNSQLGYKESIKDTARVLGRFYDGIEFRGFKQEHVEELAAHAGVPVWNGLTDKFHPTQIIADFMTMLEHGNGKQLHQMKLCYLGDGTNNVATSLMVGAAKMGMDFRIAAPGDYFPEKGLVDECKNVAGSTGANISITENLGEAVDGCDFLYGDVWVSMGEPKEVWDERIKVLRPYQVNAEVLKKTNNVEKVRYLHCLPAFHDRETVLGKEISGQYGFDDGIEVTDAVFESDSCIAFDEAENRLHSIKAIMVATLGG